ncbi:MAG: 16S rRNA (guanine(966)-N(2))-methyltransferase RsmD [SAR86 cluster bacterium]|uniref:Ribosomal RNA small subunit methyltransferase D n=1 Tax=SAR86 cluster bacterium TaxID=2030880 RepID=A0A2A4MS16_9GAMM|nr:MAG: 16S rRNA (guanine(966)-N(2))-methyltransferase RsmD [SAR86 cluster bacterium]
MKAKQNSVRIIAGKWRSRKVHFPDAPGLRPSADRVRETLFNWLQADIAQASCLDLFAGSGVCGIEALSRGAKSVVFIDNSTAVQAALRQNLQRLDAHGARQICADSLQWLSQGSKSSTEKFGIVFIDPPFSNDMIANSCAQLQASELLKPSARIYLESDRKIQPSELPQNWGLLKEKKAGAVYFYLYSSGLNPS